MIQANVIGNVMVENSKSWLENPSYLVVQPVETDDILVALDLVGARQGERVLVSQGSSCRQTELTREKPVDALVCGVIDIVVRDDKEIYNKDKG